MIESLEELDEEFRKTKKKLYFFYGHPEQIVDQCLQELGVDQVFVNRDYTPYSQKRDQKIAVVCKKRGAAFHQFDDALLHRPEDTLKADHCPYAVFTPYFRRASQLKVAKPQNVRLGHFYSGPIAFAKERLILHKVLPKRSVHLLKGGRRAGLKILANIKEFASYRSNRDFPAKDTTHLSPYLKFNVCSVREIYHAICAKLGSRHELIRSLYWRDFFTSIAFFFPYVFEGAFHSKFDQIAWNYDQKAFLRWCEGKTGFPIVDAGMREMNATGFMHNRARMICASFLVKDLHIDWRRGEKYFAQMLIDYDPAVNNGNWQWVAGTGSDAQPYFRVFNPWIQQKKFDPQCVYIKRWVPELRSIAPAAIHRWEQECSSSFYFEPMVDHNEESQEAIRRYRLIRKND